MDAGPFFEEGMHDLDPAHAFRVRRLHELDLLVRWQVGGARVGHFFHRGGGDDAVPIDDQPSRLGHGLLLGLVLRLRPVLGLRALALVGLVLVAAFWVVNCLSVDSVGTVVAVAVALAVMVMVFVVVVMGGVRL